jgi:hypothetical protein
MRSLSLSRRPIRTDPATKEFAEGYDKIEWNKKEDFAIQKILIEKDKKK